MTMRAIQLPADLMPLTDMVTQSFQYPENEAWGVQSDEKEQLVGSMKNLSRIWPLIRLIQVFSPPLRDLLTGYVWEEEGQIVGGTIVQRRGSTDVWLIGTVGVLPTYRRRGIARKLLEVTLDLIRQRGGTKTFLGVIDANLPARTLYEKLGFESYSGDIVFEARPDGAPPQPLLPEGYVQAPLGPFDWRPRYELERRIAPQRLHKYEPVQEGRFRQPAMMRLLLPLILFAQGVREQDIVIRTSGEGQVVARGGYRLPKRGEGVNQLQLRLDPAHADLASYLVAYLLHQAVTLAPGKRVEILVPQWMEAAVAAIEEAGFQRRMVYSRMGLEL